MKDLDMIGDATRLRCEKYSRERVVVPDPQMFRHLTVLTTSNSNRPLTQCFSSALARRGMKDIHRIAIDALREDGANDKEAEKESKHRR